MKEADLVNRFMTHLKTVPHAVAIKHSDAFVAGIPDVSFTFRGMSLWIEVKHANPRLEDRLVQRETIARMDRASGGKVWYLVYREDPQQTVAVRPGDLPRFMEWLRRGRGVSVNDALRLDPPTCVLIADGHDHRAAAGFFVRLSAPQENP
jgi:hypothetical protein